MSIDALYIGGAFLVVCIALFYLWLRAEGKLRER